MVQGSSEEDGWIVTFLSLRWTRRMRLTGILRILAIVFTLVTTWFFANAYFNYVPVRSVNLRSWLGTEVKATREYFDFIIYFIV